MRPGISGEAPRKKKNRAQRIERLLRREYPDPKIALEYSSPHQLLIAVILSAQCTDARVNIVTRELFLKYKGVRDFASADQRELEGDIHSTGFYRNKARNIIACCRELLANHRGEVPRTMDELLALPGVGRKTANCVLGGAFGIPSGVIVDTHVKRVSQRLRLTDNVDPDRIETDLKSLIEEKDWFHFSNALIYHGRGVCGARAPQCNACVLCDLCPSARRS